MSQQDCASGLETGDPVQDRLSALRAAGAATVDPVALHTLEAMARRAAGRPAAVQRLLEARIAQAATSLENRLHQAREQGSEMLAAALERFPQAKEALQAHAQLGNVQGIKRELVRLQAQSHSLSLAALTRQLGEESSRNAPGASGRVELKTLSKARGTWARLSADKQVKQALAQAPANAGPINSHMLMLRSLETMRAISPDYLHRFITYADTLLRLEDCARPEPEKVEKAKKPRMRTTRKKTP